MPNSSFRYQKIDMSFRAFLGDVKWEQLILIAEDVYRDLVLFLKFRDLINRHGEVNPIQVQFLFIRLIMRNSIGMRHVINRMKSGKDGPDKAFVVSVLNVDKGFRIS